MLRRRLADWARSEGLARAWGLAPPARRRAGLCSLRSADARKRCTRCLFSRGAHLSFVADRGHDYSDCDVGVRFGVRMWR